MAHRRISENIKGFTFFLWNFFKPSIHFFHDIQNIAQVHFYWYNPFKNVFVAIWIENFVNATSNNQAGQFDYFGAKLLVWSRDA